MKKLNKLFAILVAMAMVLSLTAISAFAAEYSNDSKAVVGSEDSPANGAVTKELQVPAGTAIPAVGYEITFTATVPEGKTDYQPAANVKKFDPKYFSFATSDAKKTTDNVTSVVKVEDIFATPGNVNDLFKQAGRYGFTVKETNKVFSDITNKTEYTASSDETFDNSKAEYLMTVDVAQDANGNLYVKNISVEKILDDDGNDPAAEEEHTKTNPVTPTPPTEPGDEEGTTVQKGTDFRFVNKYSKKLASGLKVSKTVANVDNTKPVTDAQKKQEFPFTVTVTQPGTTEGTATYTAYIKKGTSIIKPAQNVVKITGASYNQETGALTFTSGNAATIPLKDGEELVFDTMDIGATYTVTEAKDAGYTQGATVDGTAKTMDNLTGLIDADGIAVSVTNTSKNNDVPPEGILISNLPYIALALVAIGGLVAYVVIRRRNADEA